jgi:hypothetical protein
MAVFNDRILLNKVTAPTSSPVIEVASASSSVLVKLDAPGAATCTILVYGGIYDDVADVWAVKTLDATITLSSTDQTRTNLLSITKKAQIEVSAISGSGANVTVGFINYSL